MLVWFVLALLIVLAVVNLIISGTCLLGIVSVFSCVDDTADGPESPSDDDWGEGNISAHPPDKSAGEGRNERYRGGW